MGVGIKMRIQKDFGPIVNLSMYLPRLYHNDCRTLVNH
jgi:hypothetical protein